MNCNPHFRRLREIVKCEVQLYHTRLSLFPSLRMEQLGIGLKHCPKILHRGTLLNSVAEI